MVIFVSRFKFKSNKTKKKICFKEKSEMPASVLASPHIEAFSNKEIIIDGCKGVIDYSDDYIKLKLKKGSLILCGSSFYIYLFENGTINIKGELKTMEFCI